MDFQPVDLIVWGTLTPLCKAVSAASDKKAKWKLISVKASLKYAWVCAARSDTSGVIPIVEAPPVLSLCELIHLQTPLHPPHPPFVVSPSFCPLPPPHPSCLPVRWFPGVQCSLCSDLMLRSPTSLTTLPWFVIYALTGTGLTHLGCVGYQEAVGGEGEAERLLESEVASSSLGPRRVYCHWGRTSAGSGSGVCWWDLLVASLWKPQTNHRRENLFFLCGRLFISCGLSPLFILLGTKHWISVDSREQSREDFYSV